MLRRTALLALVLVGCSADEVEFKRLTSREQKNCGDFTLKQAICYEVAEASECFNTELQEGRLATLSWKVFSIEGDPIVTSIFSEGASGFTRIVDSRNDQYGSKYLQIDHCAALRVQNDAFGCLSFVFVDCAPE